MVRKNTTNLVVTHELWLFLINKKKRPGETFDEVLRRLLKIKNKEEKK